MEATFVVVGGGIAGVTCTETLAFLEPNESILLISESSLIKTVTNLYAITKTLTHFDVVEQKFSTFNEKYPNVDVIHDVVEEINDEEHFVTIKSKKSVKYKYLCLCTGAEPKLIPQAKEFPQILGIRDTDSVEDFIKKLAKSQKIAVVGNGGIASELIYKIRNAEIHWIIKDKHLSATFVDAGAAEFFQTSLKNPKQPETINKRMRFQEEEKYKSGAALGPDWYKNFIIAGSTTNENSSLHIHYDSEIENVEKLENAHEILITLTNNEKIPCDLIVSATGVCAKRNFISKNSFATSATDGSLLVNEFMQTNLSDIYAAGDVCSVNWDVAKHWFQMKLWTQARQMGCYAAKCMSGHLQKQEIIQDFCFEMFAHSTKLFGHKVILLGLFNGQKLGTNYEILLRMTKGVEYIKFVLENNKLQGAILIGETDLEEMCENLILNQLDLSPFGDDILNPDIDIEDYFD